MTTLFSLLFLSLRRNPCNSNNETVFQLSASPQTLRPFSDKGIIFIQNTSRMETLFDIFLEGTGLPPILRQHERSLNIFLCFVTSVEVAGAFPHLVRGCYTPQACGLVLYHYCKYNALAKGKARNSRYKTQGSLLLSCNILVAGLELFRKQRFVPILYTKFVPTCRQVILIILS